VRAPGIHRFRILLSLLLLFVCELSKPVAGQLGERVLYAFEECGEPDGALVADLRGNLYGTTTRGGGYGQGCVFELSRTGSGWTESVLWNFNGPDGSNPTAALIFDKAGNLYGMGGGGDYNAGEVFELSPSGGRWSETVLHSFGSGNDGWDPQSNLIFDNAGNLYGTTENGGTRRGGTIFKLSPGPDGWSETILYTFPASIAGPDGEGPIGGVVIDRNGALYGVTEFGGANGDGAVYELIPHGSGYKEKIIHNFSIYDGLEPGSGLTIGPGPALYGTTYFGGDTNACPYVGCGLVFKLAKDAEGNWTETVLHEMSGTDGNYTVGPVVFDHAGRLYAAADSGGIMGMGSVFMLTPTLNGPWTETILHLFDFKFPDGKDGRSPYAGVISGGGKVFGTTVGGGIHEAGIVFEITPPTAESSLDSPAAPRR
jgi:uncharacterized repeat protein (TIGR03803 family)